MKCENRLYDIDEKLIDICVKIKLKNAVNDYSINHLEFFRKLGSPHLVV